MCKSEKDGNKIKSNIQGQIPHSDRIFKEGVQLSKLKFSGEGIQFSQGVVVILLIPMETYAICDFPGLIQPMTFIRNVLFKLCMDNLLLSEKC